MDVLQESHYYPFGAQLEGLSRLYDPPGSVPNATNGYVYTEEEDPTFIEYLQYTHDLKRYNGKEYNRELGLNWYDYGARWYDPVIGRFSSVDPLAEKFSFQSPFVYAVNNPIKYIDFLGLGPSNPPGWSKKTTTNKDGSLVEITINVGVVLNSTDISKEDIKTKRLDRYKKSVEKHLSGEIEGGKTKIETTLNWVGGGKDSGFYLELTDDVAEGFPLNFLTDAPGKVDEIGNTQENRIQVNPTHPEAEDDAQVVLHELDHTGGARHEDEATLEENSKNFMLGCGDCTDVSEEQFKTILENVPERNE